MDTPELARHYEQVSADWQFRNGCEMIKALALRAGDRVLDIGAGTGSLAAHASAQVGSAGLVIGIDPLPLRIDIANTKAQPNLQFKVGNAYELGEFADAFFDVIYLNAVFHWLEDQPAALRQIHRVLKPQGRLGITTGSKDHPNCLERALRSIMTREPYIEHAPATTDGLRRLNGADMEALLRGGGFTVRGLELSDSGGGHHGSAEDAVEFLRASAFGNFLDYLPSALRAQAHADLLAELDKQRTPAGIPHGGARLIAIAVK
jgi:ubiquinone/menaquinone biosynthesis C-methylase UbiE